jgi:alcohol dehydrogenase class IV
MVSPFAYQLASSIKFGIGHASKIGEELAFLCNGKKVVLISDRGVVDAGITDTLLAALKKANFGVDLFSDFSGEASAKSIDTAAELIRTTGATAVIGLGGGSALDVAKLATTTASGVYRAEHYALMANPLPPRTTTMVLLPTTAGTGAEVTRTAVFSNAENRKIWAWGDALASDCVILDPELTMTLPGPLTAATGLDAMVHAIEACSNKNSNPLVRSFGLHAIRLVAQNLNRAIDNPRDFNARANLLISATLAGMAIDGAGTGIAHGMSHALETIAGIHHGRAVALALDVAYLENAEAAPEIHAKIALALDVQPENGPPEVLARMGARAFSAFISHTGIKTSLREDGLCEDDLDRLVEASLSKENKPMCDHNCYRIGEADIRKFARRLLSR